MTSTNRTTVLVLSGKPAAVVATLATLAAQDRRSNSSTSGASGTQPGKALLCPPIGVLETLRPAAREPRAPYFHRTPGHLLEP